MNDGRMAILAEQQVTAEATAEAKRIHIEISQIDQVQGIGQPNVIAVRLRIKFLPQS